MRPISAATLIVSLTTVVAAGTVFFHFIEGWSWLDSYFFTVVTISTVGYGELVPQTPVGKIGTTVIIFVGLGIFAMAIQQFAEYHMLIRTRRRRKKLSLKNNDPAQNDDTDRG
ncbi:MAG: potassium channel family protein [Heliomarina sp.]|uniref:potassium channel family protein n=1 Tax=Heliomarina sp. TaxID=2917556 RepID=UPI004059C36D